MNSWIGNRRAPQLDQLRSDPTMPAIVFVHLGKNPAPTLVQMAKISRFYFQEAHFILITDRPSDWTQFPGQIVLYSKEQRSNRFKEFSQRHPELEGISGGYWLYTTERIFCLSILAGFLDPNQSVIHLESDVYSTIDVDIFDSFLSQYEIGTWVPRYSPSRGIGSTIISTSMHRLTEDLMVLEELISSNPRIDNDMDLLGMALNLGILKELPTLTRNLEELGTKPNVLFDALALGQYIFGQDPLHTDGIRVSGYRNPESEFDFDSSEFFLDFNKNSLGRVAIQCSGREFQIATLHLHSKVTPNPVNQDLAYWEEAIKAVNSGVKTYSESRNVDVIHSQKISFPNRFRRARKVGYQLHAKRVIRYRLSRTWYVIQNVVRRYKTK